MNAPEFLDPPVLSFRVPVFNRGRNTTVRRGRKWHEATRARLQLDDGILSPPIGLRTELKQFSALTEADLRFEHDPACRAVGGLLRVLQGLYPGFSAEEEVTLCHFDFDGR
jgi:hypothetical protein